MNTIRKQTQYGSDDPRLLTLDLLFDHVYIWFKLINLRSIAKQVIPTYINRSRPLIPDGIHLIFWTRFEKREKPDLSLYPER